MRHRNGAGGVQQQRWAWKICWPAALQSGFGGPRAWPVSSGPRTGSHACCSPIPLPVGFPCASPCRPHPRQHTVPAH